MFQLLKSPHNPEDSGFDRFLKAEIQQLDASLLPLQQGLSVGGYALYDDFNVMIIGISKHDNYLHVKAGIFYSGIIAGCSCADDPSPMDVTTEYCEVFFQIDRVTGQASVSLADE